MKIRKCKGKDSCGLERPETTDFFYFRSSTGKPFGLCKECRQKQNKKWANENPDKVKAVKKRYKQRHREKVSAAEKERKRKNWKHIQKQNKEYRAKNKDAIRQQGNEYQRRRRSEDLKFRIRDLISNAIRDGLRKRGGSKNRSSCWDKVGYKPKVLVQYLEGQFEPWMSWDNYGVYDPKTWINNDQSTWRWQIDHIKPHSDFNYTSMDDQEFKDCWALSNLRPLSAKQNILDGTNRVRHRRLPTP